MTGINFEDKKVLGSKEDPLWFEWFLCCVVFRYKIIRKMCIANIMFHFVKYAVQIYYFRNHLSYYVQYGILFFGEPYAIAAECCMLWKTEAMVKMFECFPFWAFDSCGDKVQKKIEQAVKIHRTAVLTVLISICVASSIFLYPTPSDKRILFPVLLIEEHFPKQAWFLTLAYKSTLVPLGYCSIAPSLLLIYGTQQTIYQSFMLEEQFRQVFIGSEDKDKDKLFCDKDFQDEVHKRILFCINRQNQGIQLAALSNKLTKELFAIIYPFGYGVGLAMLMFYFSIKLGYIEVTLDNMSFPIIMSLNAIAMFVGLIISGQSVEEASKMMIRSINEWKWWALDVRNQKTMLMILSGTRDLKVQFTQLLIINYDFGVDMAKTIYSLTSLLATVEKFQ